MNTIIPDSGAKPLTPNISMWAIRIGEAITENRRRCIKQMAVIKARYIALQSRCAEFENLVLPLESDMWHTLTKADKQEYKEAIDSREAEADAYKKEIERLENIYKPTIAEVDGAIDEARRLLKEQLSALEDRDSASHFRYAQIENRILNLRSGIKRLSQANLRWLGEADNRCDFELEACDKEIERLEGVHEEEEAALLKRRKEIIEAQLSVSPKSEKDKQNSITSQVTELSRSPSLSWPVRPGPKRVPKVGYSVTVGRIRGGAGSKSQVFLKEKAHLFPAAIPALKSESDIGLAALEEVVAQRSAELGWTQESAASLDRNNAQALAAVREETVDDETKNDETEDNGGLAIFGELPESSPAATIIKVEPKSESGDTPVPPMFEYSSESNSETPSEVQQRRDAFLEEQNDRKGWRYLNSAGIISGELRTGLPPMVPKTVEGVAGAPKRAGQLPLQRPRLTRCGLPQPIIRRSVVAEEGGVRMPDPLQEAFAPHQLLFHGPADNWMLPPIVIKRLAEQRAEQVAALKDPVYEALAKNQNTREGDVQLPPLSSVLSLTPTTKSTTSRGLSSSAFLRNLRRCAMYVKDVVRHDGHWLPFDDDVTQTLPVNAEGIEYEPDSESPDKEDKAAPSFNLSAASVLAQNARNSAELNRKLEASLTDAAKTARWKDELAKGGSGGLSLESLHKRAKARLHAITASSRSSLSSDDSETTDDAKPADKEETTSRFLRRWNRQAMMKGWWHTSRHKGSEPPKECLPSALQQPALGPSIQGDVEQFVWDANDSPDHSPNHFVRNPYDTEDYKKSNTVDIFSRTAKRMNEIDTVNEEGMECYFKKFLPVRKRPRSHPNAPSMALRGGCMSGEEVEEIQAKRARMESMSLLAGDCLWQSAKRKWMSDGSFIDSGLPNLSSQMPTAKRRKTDRVSWYSPREQSPEPLPPPSPPHSPGPRSASDPLPLASPPRTPPPPPTSQSRTPTFFWSLQGNHMSRSRSKKSCLIRLNLDFVPLDLPRTGDFEIFCKLNAKMLGDMERRFIKRRLRAEEIWSAWHGPGSSRRRRDSGFVEGTELLELEFPDVASRNRGERRDSAVDLEMEEEVTES